MVGIPLLMDRLGDVLDSAVIPMGVVMGVKAGSFLLKSLRYSEWCLLWDYFCEYFMNIYQWCLGRYERREWCGRHHHFWDRCDFKR